jgi:hypothetical protein
MGMYGLALWEDLCTAKGKRGVSEEVMVWKKLVASWGLHYGGTRSVYN